MKDAKHIEVDANGIRFAAYEQGRGPLLLCLHGFPDHPRSFREQVGPLAEAGYRVVAPYMRGYAPTSAAVDGCYQSAALARDVLALIDALGEQQATVFGHDWGAIAAYGAAAKTPSRVRRLITAAVPYGPTFLARFTTSYDQLKRSWYIFFLQTPTAEMVVSEDGCAFIRRLWQDWSPGWDFPEDEMDALRETFSQPGVVEAAISYYRCMLDPARQLPELADEQMAFGMAPIEVPTLYLHGASDGCLGVDLCEGMEASFPAGLRAEIIAGAGHFVHQEKPVETNRLILDFLAED